MSTNLNEEYTKEYLAQERMRGEFQTGQWSPAITFKTKLKNAFEQGLLIFVKWGLALVLAFMALQFLTGVISGSQNGTNAILYLNELQNKGYLPKVINGSVPPKQELELGKENAQTNK